MLTTVLLAAGAALFALFVYDFALSLSAFLPARREPDGPATTRFAVLIPAHDEERVVGDVVRSLRAQDYPQQLVDVYVIADNCADATAAVATRAGASVLVRVDAKRRTKGHALRWAMDRVLAQRRHDAICVFDADNVVSENFLGAMARRLRAGDRVIQAFLDTKNPHDSWVTRAIALGYLVTNRAWQRARERLGLSAALGGTGLCIATETLERFPWDPGCLTEDLEFSMNLVLAGGRVAFAHEARTFDEKPLRLAVALRQRTRWMQGHNDVARRFVPSLLRRALARRSWVCLDAALYLLQPARVLAAFAVMVGLVAAAAAGGSPHAARMGVAGAAGMVFVVAVYPIACALVERASARLLLTGMPAFWLFGFSWIPAIVSGLLRMGEREWVHTPHTQSMSLIKDRPDTPPPLPESGPHRTG